MSTIFTGLFSRGSVGIVGFHICLSSSFTIFRFFRGGKPFQCHKLPTLQRQNEFIFSGLSRGVNLLFPLLSLFVLRLCLVNTHDEYVMHLFPLLIFKNYNASSTVTHITFLLFSLFSFNVDFCFTPNLFFNSPSRLSCLVPPF